MVEIIKSTSDERLYRLVTLPNKLECVLVHDPKVQVAAAAMSVGVGSYEDSEIKSELKQGVDGIAHFLEHMLFMGNKKYPNEKEYMDYIADHGGITNAYTDSDHTCYYFTIQPSDIKNGLDRFGQFFICPLFDESSLNREMNAVNSEHFKNINNDAWREHQISRLMCEKPISNFSTGTLETLNIPKISELVKEFYKKFYSSNIMKLCVISNQSLNELENYVKEIFSDIPNYDTEIKREFNKNILKSKQLTEVVPIKEVHKLILNWNIPYDEKLYKSSPIRLLSYILESESENTLFSSLKNDLLVSDIESGINHKYNNTAVYTISLTLTNKGKLYYKTITKRIYEYIELIKNVNKSKLKEIYDELVIVSLNKFNNKEQLDSESCVTSISSELCTIKALDKKDILSHQYLYDSWNSLLEKTFKQLLEYINPNNSSIIIVSKDFDNKTSFIEKWYGICYNIYNNHDNLEDMNNNSGKIKLSELTLPRKNPYIENIEGNKRQKLDVYNTTNTIPQKIYTSDKVNIYIMKDQRFKTEYSRLKMNLYLPNMMTSSVNYVNTILLLETYQFILNSKIYELKEASYELDFKLDLQHIEISLYGKFEKFNEIIKDIFTSLNNLINSSIKEELFEVQKEIITTKYKNIKFSPPYRKIMFLIKKELLKKYYDYNDILSTLSNLSYNDFMNGIKTLFTNGNYIVYAQGNVNERINDIAPSLENLLKKGIKPVVNDMQMYKGGIGKIVKTESDVENNCVTCTCFPLDYVRPGLTKEWERKTAIGLVLETILGREYFDTMRTKQQLGYIAKAFISKLGDKTINYNLLLFLVQSEHKECEYLTNCTNNFLKEITKQLENMTDEEYKIIINSQIEILEKPEQTLLESSEYNFIYLVCTEKVFDYKERLINTYKQITKQDVIKFFNEYINKNIKLEFGINK